MDKLCHLSFQAPESMCGRSVKLIPESASIALVAIVLVVGVGDGKEKELAPGTYS